MKNGIPSDRYYFLLEWKDANMEEFISMKGGRRMCDLDTYELNKLYEAIKANEDDASNESESLVCYRCKVHGWVGKIVEQKDCEICN